MRTVLVPLLLISAAVREVDVVRPGALVPAWARRWRSEVLNERRRLACLAPPAP